MQLKPTNFTALEKHKEEVFVVVKTAPHPSIRYTEIVCTAGITKKGNWIRLYPIDFRYLPFSRQYKKYQWIEVEVVKNIKDKRPESYRPDTETIKVGKLIDEKKSQERKMIILPTLSADLEELKLGKMSLGIIKPREIMKFIVEPCSAQWSKKHQRVLVQQRLFEEQPKDLEKIPFKFSYKFFCQNQKCKGHICQIIDWEIYELFRNMQNKYQYDIDTILEKIKNKWIDQMWDKNRDSYLYLGTTMPFGTYVVLGVFWPKKEEENLFTHICAEGGT